MQHGEGSQAQLEILNRVAMPPGSLLVGGHSHISSMIGLRNQERTELVALGEDVFGLIAPFPRTDDYWPVLAELGRDNIVLLMHDGNEHNGHFLMQGDPAFDFMLDDEAAPPIADAMLLPESMIDALFASFGERLRSVLNIILSGGPRAVFVLGTPGVKADEGYLRSVLEREPVLVAAARKCSPTGELADARFTAASVRLKLWRKLQSTYARVAQESGARFIPAAPETLDVGGFLRPEFYGTDATHISRDGGKIALSYFCARARVGV